MSNQFKKPSISHADPSVKDTADEQEKVANLDERRTRDSD